VQASKASKNALIQRFCNVTNAPQAEAQAYLRAHGYKLEPAVDAYLNETADDAAGVRLTPQMEKNARARLNALFDKYKGAYKGGTACADRQTTRLRRT